MFLRDGPFLRPAGKNIVKQARLKGQLPETSDKSIRGRLS